MVEIDFDPQILPFETILHVFWNHHNPMNINEYKGRQYRSIVLYRDDTQHDVIQKVMFKREDQGKGKPDTEVAPYTTFYLAEDRHQKYYLKRYPDALIKLWPLFPTPETLMNATLTARLNGLTKGYTNLTQIIKEIGGWPISEDDRNSMRNLIRTIKW
ncbi:peptide-methionine (S)-S-oxide reductase [Paenibacillus sp. N3.4]|uniref:peptide-methionine (S)-S-oxide reductase n=1 Tax=Paenibacillus sp. N3.4 TaxID=2603222 RepID=UPI0021C2FECC|nr:peptide-methionine (S)-S-oxide reductase [Paenibacillus sp. N3.4]